MKILSYFYYKKQVMVSSYQPVNIFGDLSRSSLPKEWFPKKRPEFFTFSSHHIYNSIMVETSRRPTNQLDIHWKDFPTSTIKLTLPLDNKDNVLDIVPRELAVHLPKEPHISVICDDIRKIMTDFDATKYDMIGRISVLRNLYDYIYQHIAVIEQHPLLWREFRKRLRSFKREWPAAMMYEELIF
jgi:hypothetical protein